MKIQTGTEEYRIVSADGQESEFVPYGEPAILKVGADYYYACCDLDSEGELINDQIFRVDSVTAVKSEVEDVEVEDDEPEDEDEEEDEDEDAPVEIA
jgi:hypothetical protein